MLNTFMRPSRRTIVGRLVGLASLAMLGGFSPSWALAEAPARFMVPFPAGGAADSMARVLVEKLKEELQQTIVVENRPGASTRVAAEALKQAPADGNTVLMTLLDTMVIAPMVYNNLRYNPSKDFAPITEVATVSYALAVNATDSYRTVHDYVKAASDDTQKASLGTTGLGSTLHFLAYEFSNQSKTDMTIVPFQGGPAMVTNLMGNQIGAAMDGLGVFLEPHRARKLRILAVSGSKRASQLPEVPTFVEAGFPSLTSGSSYALYAPAGTPEAQINRWNKAMRRVLALPEVQARILSIGYEPLPGSSPAEVMQLRQKMAEHWAPIVKASNYKSD
jgi:tripartite-type tricarboxylate transporter receptor subunit TctC